MFGIVDGEQSIITGNVGCTGHETSLFSCPGFDPTAQTQCSSDHTEDAGVICFCKPCNCFIAGRYIMIPVYFIQQFILYDLVMVPRPLVVSNFYSMVDGVQCVMIILTSLMDKSCVVN